MSKLTNVPSAVNLLTFDIEEWFHANYQDINPSLKNKGSNFRHQMDKLLRLCHDYGCRATFFTLGSIGEDYPDIVKAIAASGHEIASHGYGHQLAYTQSFSEFKDDVARSIAILEDLTGSKVLGYRAPSWSIVKSNYHFLEALEQLGLLYDASIFPVKTFLYGIPDAPTEIHQPVVNGRELALYEVPMSVLSLAGQNVGFSGGFYFRLFPALLIKSAIRAANSKGRSSILYLHPREIDASEQRLALPRKEAFIHYHNIAGTEEKLAGILRAFTFCSIAEYLQSAGLQKLAPVL